jgi:hypothetical protein
MPEWNVCVKKTKDSEGRESDRTWLKFKKKCKSVLAMTGNTKVTPERTGSSSIWVVEVMVDTRYSGKN